MCFNLQQSDLQAKWPKENGVLNFLMIMSLLHLSFRFWTVGHTNKIILRLLKNVGQYSPSVDTLCSGAMVIEDRKLKDYSIIK